MKLWRLGFPHPSSSMKSWRLLATVDNGLTDQELMPEAATLMYCHPILSRLGDMFWPANNFEDWLDVLESCEERLLTSPVNSPDYTRLQPLPRHLVVQHRLAALVSCFSLGVPSSSQQSPHAARSPNSCPRLCNTDRHGWLVLCSCRVRPL